METGLADEFPLAVRRAFGIQPSTYARAFPDDLSELGTHWRQKLKESVSEGKSGSFFFRVMQSDRHGSVSRFIVKQVSRQEKATMMAMLPAYEKHVTARRGRSLIQYFGCHSMSLRWAFSEKVYFIVMRKRSAEEAAGGVAAILEEMAERREKEGAADKETAAKGTEEEPKKKADGEGGESAKGC